MIGLPLSVYEVIVPKEHVQKVFAKLLATQIKVLQSFSKIALVGNGESSLFLCGELSRILKCEFYTLPITLLSETEGDQTIYGAISGTNDALNVELEIPKRSLSPTEVQKMLQASQYKMLSDSLLSELCDSWIRNKKTINDSFTVLLIDPIIACKAKFKTAIESLRLDTTTKICPVAGLIRRDVLLSNSYPLRKGIFLKEFENLDEFSDCVRILNGKSEREIIQFLEKSEMSHFNN